MPFDPEPRRLPGGSASVLDPDEARWDQSVAQWQKDHGGAPYPFADVGGWNAAGKPGDTAITPLDVLLSRRPDLQHLPLTCENTNTPALHRPGQRDARVLRRQRPLAGQRTRGYTTDDGATPEELLASPQYVKDAAYDGLACQAPRRCPADAAAAVPPAAGAAPPLVRRVPVAAAADVMEALRKGDAVERASDADPTAGATSGWSELGLSRAEYRTPDRPHAVTLQRAFTVSPAATSDDDSARPPCRTPKSFCRRLAATQLRRPRRAAQDPFYQPR